MPRLEQDNLEFEADKSGMVHVRKRTGGTHVLPGYGITEFGVSAYEPKRILSSSHVLIGSGLLTAGMIWRFRNRLSSLYTYALLLREAAKS
jgi:hypothetical protein